MWLAESGTGHHVRVDAERRGDRATEPRCTGARGPQRDLDQTRLPRALDQPRDGRPRRAQVPRDDLHLDVLEVVHRRRPQHVLLPFDVHRHPLRLRTSSRCTFVQRGCAFVRLVTTIASEPVPGERDDKPTTRHHRGYDG